jgi:hypothetical protein
MKWVKRNSRIPYLVFLVICLAIALLVRELHQSHWIGLVICLALATLADFLERYRLDTKNRNQDKDDR